MPVRKLRAWAFIPGFVVLIAVLGLVHGSTTANSIPPSRAGISYHPTTAQQLAPPECAGMVLTSVAWGDNGTLNGTNGNELLIGSDNTNRINGRNGDDCLVIGARKDNRLDGGPGNDVCVGNATTRFDNCELQAVRGAAPAGFAPMELTPTVESLRTDGAPLGGADSGVTGAQVEPTIEPPTKPDATAAGESGPADR